MTINAMLVQMLQMSSWQLEQTVSGFDADQWFHAPAEEIASPAWIVGHATLIDRQVLEELDLPSMPAIPEDWPALYQTRPEGGAAHDDDSGKTILERFLQRYPGRGGTQQRSLSRRIPFARSTFSRVLVCDALAAALRF